MSDGEIERGLERLAARTPRPGLREEVLPAVRARLDVRPVDRLLARPLPWALAAIVLLSLDLGGALLLEDQEGRLAALALPPCPIETEIARVLPPGEARDAMSRRLRLVAMEGVEIREGRRRWAEKVITMRRVDRG